MSKVYKVFTGELQETVYISYRQALEAAKAAGGKVYTYDPTESGEGWRPL